MNETAFAMTRGSNEFSDRPLVPSPRSISSLSSRDTACRIPFGASLGGATIFFDFAALAVTEDGALELSDSDARTTSSLSLRRFAKALTLET